MTTRDNQGESTMPSKRDQDSLTSILAFQFPMIVVTAVVVGVAVWILDSSIGRDLEANRVALEENHAALVELNADITMSFDRLEQVMRSELESFRAAINADSSVADAEMRELKNLVLPPATEQAVIEEWISQIASGRHFS